MSIERDVRQMLADKISGNLMGLWLLVPEHLRLGTWDLLKAWCGSNSDGQIDPRLALQVVHESALCLSGVRQKRSLRLKGFETINGLPFVATDYSIHQLFDRHTCSEAEALQQTLGKMRYALGDYPGDIILIDPHRIQSWTQRHAPLNRAKKSAPTRKTLQTFFAINGQSGQPLSCALGSSAVTITQATLRLVEQLSCILPHEALLIGDGEHFTIEMIDNLVHNRQFTFLFPMPKRQSTLNQIRKLSFTRLWAGYAVAEWEYQIPNGKQKIRVVVQRTGETPDTFEYKPFITTSSSPAETLMTIAYPGRWDIEEFFNTEAALGWKRASTHNINIRLGKLSMSMIAQSLIYRLRKKLPMPLRSWTAEHLADHFFSRIDGDIRVRNDTIIVTLYNTPNEKYFKEQFQNLPRRLENEGVDPRIAWLYNFKLDFRFK